MRQAERPPSVNDKVDEAVVLAMSLRDGDPLVRAEIEARLIANQPLEDIAKRMGWPVEAIVAYEKLFFELTPRREASGWICHVVVRIKDRVETTKNHEYPYFWKLVAMQSGLAGLEPFLDPENVQLVRQFGLRGYLRPECCLEQPLRTRVLLNMWPQDDIKDPRVQSERIMAAEIERELIESECQQLKSMRKRKKSVISAEERWQPHDSQHGGNAPPKDIGSTNPLSTKMLIGA